MRILAPASLSVVMFLLPPLRPHRLNPHLPRGSSRWRRLLLRCFPLTSSVRSSAVSPGQLSCSTWRLRADACSGCFVLSILCGFVLNSNSNFKSAPLSTSGSELPQLHLGTSKPTLVYLLCSNKIPTFSLHLVLGLPASFTCSRAHIIALNDAASRRPPCCFGLLLQSAQTIAAKLCVVRRFLTK